MHQSPKHIPLALSSNLISDKIRKAIATTSVPCKGKKVRIVRIFLRHFLTTFRQLRVAFFDFQNYGVFVWLLAHLAALASGVTPFFSSNGAVSGAVSSKLQAEVPKVAKKDALHYLKTFFVSFV